MRERGLADARHVLDQQVAAREQARDREPQLLRLADDHAVERVEHGLDDQGGVVRSAVRDQCRRRHTRMVA